MGGGGAGMRGCGHQPETVKRKACANLFGPRDCYPPISPLLSLSVTESMSAEGQTEKWTVIEE